MKDAMAHVVTLAFAAQIAWTFHAVLTVSVFVFLTLMVW
jgi:hypothetical protein